MRSAMAFAALFAAASCGPAAANTSFAQQNLYSVTVLPGSDLSFASGYSGAQKTLYTVDNGPVYTVTANPGQFLSQTLTLRLRFQADPGWRFDGVDFSAHVDVSTVEGSGYFQAQSVVAAASGGGVWNSPTWTNGSWGYNGSPVHNSPQFGLNDSSFDLTVTLYHAAAGYPGGCSSSSGVCASVGNRGVNVSVSTVAAPIPEPGAAALLAAGLAALALRRRGFASTAGG